MTKRSFINSSPEVVEKVLRGIVGSVEGIRNVIRLLGLTNEKIRRLKAEDLVDDRFVKKLEREGLF